VDLPHIIFERIPISHNSDNAHRGKIIAVSTRFHLRELRGALSKKRTKWCVLCDACHWRQVNSTLSSLSERESRNLQLQAFPENFLAQHAR
jgi:hypothetical protein